MSAVSELEHVLVLCTDIETTREFYERAVGLRAGDRPPLQFDGYWLYAGEHAVPAHRRPDAVRGARCRRWGWP